MTQRLEDCGSLSGIVSFRNAVVARGKTGFGRPDVVVIQRLKEQL